MVVIRWSNGYKKDIVFIPGSWTVKMFEKHLREVFAGITEFKFVPEHINFPNQGKLVLTNKTGYDSMRIFITPKLAVLWGMLCFQDYTKDMPNFRITLKAEESYEVNYDISFSCSEIRVIKGDGVVAVYNIKYCLLLDKQQHFHGLCRL